MKLERAKNTKRNIFFGLLNKVTNIILPFIVRTIFIKKLGTEYLGLNSLFSSILTVLNLTELGFSNAIVFSMYKPIAENDDSTINALLLYYKKAYRILGCIILISGISIAPFLNYFINGTYPENINIYIVYSIFLLNTTISYFLFAYRSALITAFQREDIISKINMLMSSTMYILQIILLSCFKNYYFYIILMPLFTIINNIRTAIVSKKMFPQYNPCGYLSKEQKADIKEKISGLMVSKICNVTRNAFDNIFISMFLGLTVTGIYNNYYYIMNAIISIMTVITTSVTAGVGNSICIESEEKNYKDMNYMNFWYMWISGWFSICLLCLYQPFMHIWVGKKLMFDNIVVILICIYFYVLKMGDVRTIYVQAKGFWWENRFRAIFEALLNLILNYILGKIFGVYGIIIATLISLFLINFCYGSQIIFKYYFKSFKITEYFKMHGLYVGVTFFIAAITYYICQFNILGNELLSFVVKGVICAILPNLLYFIIYYKNKIFNESKIWLFAKIKK